MKRVSIVNLAGRAFHVEDDGVAALESWLADARTRLEPDPDRDELLADFERAIAEKLDAHAAGERDVVTGAQAQEVLASLGTIELPAADISSDSGDATANAPTSQATPLRERRLYRLTGDDEKMIAGVCSGLAAYLNLDVTVVRVLTVLLTVLTSGGAAIVYIAMALIVPEADSPDKRAAVRGYGETAQELMSRAREGASPALASLGSLIRRTWTFITTSLRWLFLAITWLLLAAWGIAVTWIVTDGDGLLSAFDEGTSTWMVALWATCIAWLVVSVTLGMAGLLRRLTPGATQRPARWETAATTAWVASVVLAIVGLWAIPYSSSGQLRALQDGQGRIELWGETYCIVDPHNDDVPTNAERCRDGDVVLDDEDD